MGYKPKFFAQHRHVLPDVKGLLERQYARIYECTFIVLQYLEVRLPQILACSKTRAGMTEGGSTLKLHCQSYYNAPNLDFLDSNHLRRSTKAMGCSVLEDWAYATVEQLAAYRVPALLDPQRYLINRLSAAQI